MAGYSGARGVAMLLLMAVPAASEGPFAWKDIGEGRMQLQERGNNALVYNYGPQWKQGTPEDRRRCCYIFPFYTPAGVSMLDDFPQDHWHHRGLFWAWPVVETGGKTYDLWMNMTVKDHGSKPPAVSQNGNQAELRAQNSWQVEGRDIVREDVHLTVFPSKDGAREMEVELTWQALQAPVTIRGSREAAKSYGGFSARFAPREGTVLRADGERLTKDEDLNPRRWAELEGVYGGKRVALRITPDASGPGAPYQWCLRDYGFVGASFPGKTATKDGYTMEPGKPLTLRFRVRASDLR